MKVYIYKHPKNNATIVVSFNPYIVYTKDKIVDLEYYTLIDTLITNSETFNINKDYPELLV